MKQSEFDQVLAKNEKIIAEATDPAIVEQAEKHIEQCRAELEPLSKSEILKAGVVTQNQAKEFIENGPEESSD